MAPTASAPPGFAHPGLLLGPSTKYLPGPGTHLHNNNITASIAGTPTIIPPASNTQPSLPTISILHPSHSHAPRAPLSRSVVSTTPVLPTLSSTVLARVTRLEKARVSVNILVVDNSTSLQSQLQSPNPSTGAEQGIVLPTPLPAVIRREDVRGWEVDKVNVPEMFRVGDIVRATVISIGDQQAYYLSTAKNELGVLMARSESDGNAMFPISWKEFKDPKTGMVEGRKVAKPV